MTLWARLTWQAAEPAAFGTALAARLGIPAEVGGGPDGCLLELGTAVLDVRPWLRESAGEDPSPGGRLVLEPVPGGEEPPSADPRPPLVLAGVGWATVELDRAEEELAPWLGVADADAATESVTGDPHLGARARVRAGGGLPGDAVVLLEPATEGRLAASLARDGEGPCALYLRPAQGLAGWSAAARERGVALSAERPGPLGPSRLVLGGPVAGPYLLLVGDAGPRYARPLPVPSPHE